MEKVNYWIKCNKSTCIIISMILVTVVIVGVILSFGNSNESELDTVQTSYMPSETASVEVLGSVETTEPTQTVQPTATVVPTETAMPTATAVATVKPTTSANKTSSKKKVIPLYSCRISAPIFTLHAFHHAARYFSAIKKSHRRYLRGFF